VLPSIPSTDDVKRSRNTVANESCFGSTPEASLTFAAALKVYLEINWRTLGDHLEATWKALEVQRHWRTAEIESCTIAVGSPWGGTTEVVLELADPRVVQLALEGRFQGVQVAGRGQEDPSGAQEVPKSVQVGSKRSLSSPSWL